MPSVKVFDMKGAQVGEMALSESVFGVPMNDALVHQVVRIQQLNKRQGTQSALTRAEVSGGGKKPWRQKGTGRARQGSTRSPQWTKGGIVFAPKPRDWSMSIPRKMKQAAIRCALSDKVASEKFIIVDKIFSSEGKTRDMAAALKALGIDRKALIIFAGKDELLSRATANIPGLKIALVNTLNAVDILSYDKFVIAKEAVTQVEEVYA